MSEQVFDNVATAQAYYRAYVDKDAQRIFASLHGDVELISPISTARGKQEVLGMAKRLMEVTRAIEIRAEFGAGDRVMLAYDLDCAPPLGRTRAAVLFTFRAGLIARIELFFDPRPFLRH
jgi:hypothetical protein